MPKKKGTAPRFSAVHQPPVLGFGMIRRNEGRTKAGLLRVVITENTMRVSYEKRCLWQAISGNRLDEAPPHSALDPRVGRASGVRRNDVVAPGPESPAAPSAGCLLQHPSVGVMPAVFRKALPRGGEKHCFVFVGAEVIQPKTVARMQTLDELHQLGSRRV